jgi:hypothetical protein
VSWFTHHASDEDAAEVEERAPAPARAQAVVSIAQPTSPSPTAGEEGRELFARHARKDGRLIAILRAVDLGSSCKVEAEVYPHGSNQLSRPGPYTFPDAQQASAFVTEAVAALMYLGCDIQAE